MNFVKHFFKRHLCVDNIYIDESGGGLTPALRCSRCNREIGFIYLNQDGWKTFLRFNFRRYKLEIERWVYEHTKDRNHMVKSSEREWGEMLHNIKQWHEDDIQSVGREEWTGECEENSEGCESDGARENDGGVTNDLRAIQTQVSKFCMLYMDFRPNFHYKFPVL